MKRTFNEEAREFSDNAHQIGRIILAWLAGHAIRMYQRVEDWRESREE